MISDDVCNKVQNGHFDQTECMNCMECVSACKTGALGHSWVRH